MNQQRLRRQLPVRCWKGRGKSMARSVFLKFALGVVLMGGMGACLAAKDQAADQPNTSAASARMNQPYSEEAEKTCLTCHNSPPVNYILQTPMAVKSDPRTPFGQHGCESCHGPSGDHAKQKSGPD